jgi:hypothetical protein
VQVSELDDQLQRKPLAYTIGGNDLVPHDSKEPRPGRMSPERDGSNSARDMNPPSLTALLVTLSLTLMAGLALDGCVGHRQDGFEKAASSCSVEAGAIFSDTPLQDWARDRGIALQAAACLEKQGYEFGAGTPLAKQQVCRIEKPGGRSWYPRLAEMCWSPRDES